MISSASSERHGISGRRNIGKKIITKSETTRMEVICTAAVIQEDQDPLEEKEEELKNNTEDTLYETEEPINEREEETEK